MNDRQNYNYTKLVESVNRCVYSSSIKAELLAFLESIKLRLAAAPASSKHHQAEPGGLLDHINDVLRLAQETLHGDLRLATPDISPATLNQCVEDLTVATILHDIHKIGDPTGGVFYQPNMIKNKKKDGPALVQSTAKPFERNDGCYKLASVVTPPGSTTSTHREAITAAVAACFERNMKEFPEGELSILLVHALRPSLYALLNQEVLYAIRHHDGAYAVSGYALAGKETPVMLALHHADMVSSRKNRWFGAGSEDSSSE